MRKIVKEVISYENQPCHEVTINFVTTQAISQLHADFFNDPTTTDCISFPMDEETSPYRILGEIFVCPKTALDYAEAHDKDPQQELILYVIHGLLHLMGYDDIDPKDRRKMRIAERRHIKHLEYTFS